MNVGFVGAGKVGFSLGKFFTENEIHVTGYYSRHIESALEAAKFTQSKVYEELDLLVSDSDDYGAYGYSIHPLFPVSNKLTSYRELPGAFFALKAVGYTFMTGKTFY